jgi:hypothetical protein
MGVAILLAVLAWPVYAEVLLGVPGADYSNYPQPSGSSSYCLQWVPPQMDEFNRFVPGHYVNICQGYSGYGSPYYGSSPYYGASPYYGSSPYYGAYDYPYYYRYPYNY